MASLKHEFVFDFLPRGGESVPTSFSLFGFAAARSQEIAALTQAIDEPVRTGQVFQHLPKHMRRRVMSHKVKRVPVKLREAHRRLMEKSGYVEGSESKRPSRKYRRRPRNLLEEYNRRQRSAIWLETHIWHAKRFHVADKWGYKLADFPKDKSFRACYRASANHCLIQDISYYVCIELHGRLEELLSGLQRHTSIHCGLTFAAKCTLDGSREGSVIMFRAGMYPRGVIGSTRFLWRPAVEGVNERTIWMWVHPSCYSNVVEEFVVTFQLEQTMGITAAEEIDNGSVKNVETAKIALRNVPFNRTPKYESRGGGVVMVLLKDTLNRFRLTGPLSQSCLSAAFRVAVMSDKDCLNDGGHETRCGDVAIDQANGWWKEFYGRKGQSQLATLHQQADLWHQLSSAATTPAQLPPHTVLPLTIVDPRLEMPTHRTKALIASSATPAIAQPPPLVAGTNPLWDPYMRDAVTQGKLPSATLDALRAQRLVPGSPLMPSERLMRLPVLLIQRPGNQNARQRLGYGSGWDVVMPCGWGMPVWLGLVFRGARAGGLREAESVTQEAGLAAELPPDSVPGRALQQDRASELHGKHFRLPPGKRPNYTKLGVATPFLAPWEMLLRDWSKAAIGVPDDDDDCESFYVLRDSVKLQWLAALVSGRNLKSTRVEFSADERRHCLVPVGVLVKGRGVLKTYAHICIPTLEDLHSLQSDAECRGPMEPVHTDCNATERKKSHATHLQLLKRLRRKRVRTKLRLKKHGNNHEENEWDPSTLKEEGKKKKKRPKPTEHIVREQSDKMQRLWLPQDVAEIKDSASRSIMGFLVSGDFRFTEACSAGQGYVTLSALLEYIRSNSVWRQELLIQPAVLLRNVSSFQYSFADLRILSF